MLNITFFLIVLSSEITNPKSNLAYLFFYFMQVTSNRKDRSLYLNYLIASDLRVNPLAKVVKIT